MTRSLIAALLAALIATSADGQTLWQWQHPRPLGHALYAVATIDDNRMVAVGGLATWLTTTDQGGSWQFTTPADGRGYLWQGIHVVDATHVIALGLNAAYLSSDAGSTWTRRPVADTTHGYTSMAFTDLQHGWIAGPNGTMERTTDGGMTWSPMTSGTTSALSVAFADSLNGWAVGAVGLVLHTTNGGVSWTSQGNITINGLVGAAFRSSSAGIVVGGNGSIYQTTNGGTTWTPRTSGTSEALYAIAYQDSATVIAVGNTGTILRSTDGGVSWARKSIPSDLLFRAVTMRPSGIGWAVGQAGIIYRTTDGGASWTERSSVSTYSPINDLQFVTADVGFAVDNKGAVLKTSDGGTHWAAIDTAANSLSMIHFTSSLKGARVDRNGVVDTTIDGGVTWHTKSTIPSTVATPLFLVGQFVTDSLWFVVGATGTAARTTNGGATWEKPNTRTTAYCYGLFFQNALRGWMTGASSTLRKTTDGGVNWDTVTTGLSGTLYNVYFVDDSVGWVAGGNGALIKTTDGGTTWANQTTGLTNGTIQSMRFFDRLNGYIGPTVTTFGSLLRTTNGGVTWTAENIGTTFVINCMRFTDADHGWLAGNSGGILRKNAGATAVALRDIPLKPGRIRLEQNFPNPFNPSTRIVFHLAATGHVRMAIYDVLGREVAVLLNEVVDAGRYERTFDATGLASGVYLCRVTAGADGDVRKMLLVR